MKANELRIGNYVNLYGSQATIIPNDFQKWFQNEPNWENKAFKPILLTEEWLLKFGFTHNGGYSWDCKKLGCQRYIENHLTKGYFETNYESKHIQYAHQLQNLYFALTGQELEIVT